MNIHAHFGGFDWVRFASRLKSDAKIAENAEIAKGNSKTISSFSFLLRALCGLCDLCVDRAATTARLYTIGFVSSNSFRGEPGRPPARIVPVYNWLCFRDFASRVL